MKLWVVLYLTAWTEAGNFDQHIEPILRKHCLGCHGRSVQQSGLRLDDREAALRGGASGRPAIVPGKSTESELIARVTGRARGMAMPPSGKRLSAEEIEQLRVWIDQGAVYTKDAARRTSERTPSGHWAFQPIRRPAVPPGADHPVDAFVRARLKEEGIAPSAEGPKAVLLRRLSLDLTGLPPTPEEMAAFLNDQAPGAWERQVERLLASPHYGEKWARHWLDLARYADSDGYEKDWPRPHAWRYRHWVIEALNRDMPFDRFTIEQIAGDLLPEAGFEQKVATGFHRQTLTNREGGVDNEQFRFENLVDRTSAIGTVWLGLTLGCAQCHDHKYDPITQKDFYRLAAFFENLEEVDIDAPLAGELGPWLATRDEYRAKREQLLKEYGIAELQASWEKEMLRAAANPGERTDWDLAWDCLLKLTEGGDGEKILRRDPKLRSEREQEVLTRHFIRNYHFAVGQKRAKELKLDELDKKLRELEASYPQLSQAMVVAESEIRRPSHVRVRGDYKNLGAPVEPGVPSTLPPLKCEQPTRLDLARWLVSRENPLTARVLVNRVWQEYFGQGLVRTSEDFGAQGERPSHPELLDWLAAEFMEGSWSLKRLHRIIVTSATYKQSSGARPDLESRDPANVLLARQVRLRLPAELIRDAALAVSGLLYPAVGGPSVRPPQPKGVAELTYAEGAKWTESTGKDRYRRGIYIHFQRTSPYPLLVNFDAPKAVVPACRRQRSNTPLQALNLLNDPVFLEAARALAEQARQWGRGDWGRTLTRIYELALGRKPSGAEADRLRTYFDREQAVAGEEAAWNGVASVILNLDEFIVRE